MKKNNIFVGNLAFTTTREEVMAICQAHGTVVSIRMKKNAGYAFVEMATADQAQAVIDNLDGKDRGGRVVKVTHEISAKKAKPKAVETFKKNKDAARLEYRKKMEKTRDTGTGRRKPAGKRGNFRNDTRKGSGRRGAGRFEPRDDFQERKQPGRRDSFEKKEPFGNKESFGKRESFGNREEFRPRDDSPGNRPPFRKPFSKSPGFRNEGGRKPYGNDRPGFKKPFSKGPGFGKSPGFRNEGGRKPFGNDRPRQSFGRDAGFGKPRGRRPDDRPSNDRGPRRDSRGPGSRGPRPGNRGPRRDSRGPRQ